MYYIIHVTMTQVNRNSPKTISSYFGLYFNDPNDPELKCFEKGLINLSKLFIKKNVQENYPIYSFILILGLPIFAVFLNIFAAQQNNYLVKIILIFISLIIIYMPIIVVLKNCLIFKYKTYGIIGPIMNLLAVIILIAIRTLNYHRTLIPHSYNLLVIVMIVIVFFSGFIIDITKIIIRKRKECISK